MKAYLAFCIYRDIEGRRSIQAVSDALREKKGGKIATGRLQKPCGCLYKWSLKNKWVSRAAAYDEYLKRQDRKGTEKKWKELLLKKETSGKALQSEFVTYMKKHQDKDVNSLPLAIDCLMKGLALEEEALGIYDELDAFMERYQEFKEKLWRAVMEVYGKDAPEKILQKIKNNESESM